MVDDSAKTTTGTAGQGAGATDQAAGFARATADRLRDAGQQAQSAFQEGVVEPAQRAGEAMRQGGEKVAASNQQIGVRMIDQAESNAQEAFAAMRKAAQAKDLSEVMRVQGDYLREQSQRSIAQAREIGELIANFGREAVGMMRGGTGAK